MSTPRFRRNADGRWARWSPSTRQTVPPWIVHSADGRDWERVEDADVHGEGWSEAVLVVLPEPQPFERELATGARFGPVEASVRADGAQFLGSGVQGYRTPEDARRTAAGLLAAAAWVEATPPPPWPKGATP